MVDTVDLYALLGVSKTAKETEASYLACQPPHMSAGAAGAKRHDMRTGSVMGQALAASSPDRRCCHALLPCDGRRSGAPTATW